MFLHTVVATLALTLWSACIVPMTQPLRLSTGPWVSATASGHIGVDGADPPGNVGGLGVQVAAGYAHTFGHFGVSGGVTIPTFENQQGDGGADLATWSLTLGAQGEAWGAIAGGELGGGGGALVIGGIVRVAELDQHADLQVGVYGRRYWPWDPDVSERIPQTPAWDIGARVRVWMLMAQYSHYRVDRGTIRYEGFEGASPAVHIVTLGLIFDGDVFRDLF